MGTGLLEFSNVLCGECFLGTAMELIDQHTKRIMEGCKERAREAGLRFHDETLEYIVTNRDLLELSPEKHDSLALRLLGP